jgi:hypothetical protein
MLRMWKRGRLGYAPGPKIELFASDPSSDDHVAYLSMRNAVRMIERGQAWLDSNNKLRVSAPSWIHDHPCRTRISSGGLLAALGMSQIHTIANARGAVHDFKYIAPEDRACFHQATNPGGNWIAAAVSLAATAFSILIEAGTTAGVW